MNETSWLNTALKRYLHSSAIHEARALMVETACARGKVHGARAFVKSLRQESTRGRTCTTPVATVLQEQTESCIMLAAR